MTISQNGHQTDTQANHFSLSNPAHRAFLEWEGKTNDILDFKKAYVDAAGDLNAGIMLSHIVYWHLPNKAGKSKLQVKRAGNKWIAVTGYEWWERVRLSPKQANRALKILKSLGLIEKRTFQFAGRPTMHVRLVLDVFKKQLSEVLRNPVENPFLPTMKAQSSPNGDNDIDQRDETFSPNGEFPYTESTTENTKTSDAVASPVSNALFPSMPNQPSAVREDEEDRAEGEKANPYTAAEHVVMKLSRSKSLTGPQFRNMNRPIPYFDDSTLLMVTGLSINETYETDELYRRWIMRVIIPEFAKQFTNKQPSRTTIIQRIGNFQRFYQWKAKQPAPLSEEAWNVPDNNPVHDRIMERVRLAQLAMQQTQET